MRVTLVTGALCGIGAATARRIAAPGEALLLHARGGQDGRKTILLEGVAAACRAKGAAAETRIADPKQDDAADLVAAALAHWGRLDRLVAHAGFAAPHPMGAATQAGFDRADAVMLSAFVDLVTAALPSLTASDAGRIVAVTAGVADLAPGGPLFPAGAAAQGALLALAQRLATQLAPMGVTVNCVTPGFTETDARGPSAGRTSIWRDAAPPAAARGQARPSDVAAAINFFLSDEASHITGQTLRIDCGLAPA